MLVARSMVTEGGAVHEMCMKRLRGAADVIYDILEISKETEWSMELMT
jgi:hypothetical protein